MMLQNRWIVFTAALILWAVYFHTVDWALMEAQGLPVATNLMPE